MIKRVMECDKPQTATAPVAFRDNLRPVTAGSTAYWPYAKPAWGDSCWATSSGAGFSAAASSAAPLRCCCPAGGGMLRMPAARSRSSASSGRWPRACKHSRAVIGIHSSTVPKHASVTTPLHQTMQTSANGHS